MREMTGDLWQQDGVLCITTNGTVLPNGQNIMGGGTARQAADHFAYLGLPYLYGQMLLRHGIIVEYLPLPIPHTHDLCELVMFPVKYSIEEHADIGLIQRSCRELRIMAGYYDWHDVYLPRPGCALGGLDWKDVKPAIEPLLDDRFIAITL